MESAILRHSMKMKVLLLTSLLIIVCSACRESRDGTPAALAETAPILKFKPSLLESMTKKNAVIIFDQLIEPGEVIDLPDVVGQDC